MMSYNYFKNIGVFLGKVIDNNEVVLEISVGLGDGIRFNDDGFILSKILFNGKEVKEVFKGDKVKLFLIGGYKKGYRLFKMFDKKLYDGLKDYVKLYKRKIFIEGEVEFKVNLLLIIIVKFNNK